VVLEVPKGAIPLRFPVREFIVALRAVTFELLRVMYADEPQLLAQKGLFAEGSMLDQAAQLILQGKASR
jgi:hypothetical protein